MSEMNLPYKTESSLKARGVSSLKTLRQKVKEKIHHAHIGIQGCLRRAREVVYWPSMNQEISDYIEHCDTCNMYTSHPQQEPLIVHDVPERPWQLVVTYSPWMRRTIYAL